MAKKKIIFYLIYVFVLTIIFYSRYYEPTDYAYKNYIDLHLQYFNIKYVYNNFSLRLRLELEGGGVSRVEGGFPIPNTGTIQTPEFGFCLHLQSFPILNSGSEFRHPNAV